jgi:outer membrane protein
MGRIGIACGVLLLVVSAGDADAQHAGDSVLGAGRAQLQTRDKSKPLNITGGTSASGPVANTGSSVSNEGTLEVTYSYFVTDHVAVTGVGGIPPRFDLSGGGILSSPDINPVASAKQWSPALLLRYYFNDSDAAFRPFVGVGAAYFWYSDVRLSQGLTTTLVGGVLQRDLPRGALSPAAIGQVALGARTTATLSKSLAPVMSVGANYKLDRRWSLTASVSYVHLSTTANLKTTVPLPAAAGGPRTVTSSTRLRLDPLVGYVSVNYAF